MTRKIAIGFAAAAATVALLVPSAGGAAPLQPACIVVDVPPVHLQLGYAPNGPEDCTVLPPA